MDGQGQILVCPKQHLDVQLLFCRHRDVERVLEQGSYAIKSAARIASG